ncbi:hypothetical protein Plhal304r1_c046g0128241 [Plasmopara halstedii]
MRAVYHFLAVWNIIVDIQVLVDINQNIIFINKLFNILSGVTACEDEPTDLV